MFIIKAVYKGNDKRYNKRIKKLVGKNCDEFWTNGKITILTWKRKSEKSWARICSILGRLNRAKLYYHVQNGKQ